MTYPQNLVAPDSASITELWSFDRTCVFRLVVRGYESTDHEWLDVDVEFESKNRFYRIKKWEFDTLELASVAKKISRTKTDLEARRTLLRSPYKGDELDILFKKGYLKRVPQPFLRNRQGNFVTGKFQGFEFEFRVNAVELLLFSRSLKLAASKFPGRTDKGIDLIRKALT
jgi:hypothetical protein